MAVISLLGEKEQIKAPARPAVVPSPSQAEPQRHPHRVESGPGLTGPLNGSAASWLDPMHDPHCIFCKIVRRRDPLGPSAGNLGRRCLPRHQPAQSGPHPPCPSLAPRPPGRASRRDRRPCGLAPAQALPRRQGCHGGRGAQRGHEQRPRRGSDHRPLHWHIIPRFTGDPLHWPWPQGKYSGDELSQMKSRIEGRIEGRAGRFESRENSAFIFSASAGYKPVPAGRRP